MDNNFKTQLQPPTAPMIAPTANKNLAASHPNFVMSLTVSRLVSDFNVSFSSFVIRPSWSAI